MVKFKQLIFLNLEKLFSLIIVMVLLELNPTWHVQNVVIWAIAYFSL